MQGLEGAANDGQRASAMPHAAQGGGDGGVVGERLDDAHDVGVVEEDQPAVAVVVGERAERLGPQGDLRVERQRPVEHGTGGRRQ